MFYYINFFYFIYSFTIKNSNCATFFIAAGTRDNTIQKNIKHFKNCDCVIFKYTTKNLNIGSCKEVYKKTSWSKFLMLSDNYIKKEHKYVTIVLDDVYIKNYSFHKVKNEVDRYEESVVTPRIHGSYYEYKKIKFTEIFVTTFSKSSWNCWIEMMKKLKINFKKTIGWGFDLCFPIFCPNVIHIKNDGLAFHKYSPRNHKFNKIGKREIRKYNNISLSLNKKPCINQT